MPRFELSVAAGSPDDFGLWRWAVSPMFAMDPMDRRDRDTFEMLSSGYHFHEMAITTTRSTATRFDRNRSVVAKSGIDNIMLQIYQTSDYRFDADGREQIVEAGDIALIDLTRPSRLETSDYTNICMVLPRHLLAPMVADLDRVHGLILRKGTPLNAILGSHMRNLLAEARDLNLAAAAALTPATAGLVAACVGPSNDAQVLVKRSVSISLLRLVRKAVDANLANPNLSPDFLAKQFRISRATLYRLFEPLGGVRNYIQQRRLMRAYQALSDPALFSEKVGALAERWGFSEKTMFSRAFRATYGLAPTEARAFALRGHKDSTLLQQTSAGSFWALNRWLFGLETESR